MSDFGVLDQWWVKNILYFKRMDRGEVVKDLRTKAFKVIVKMVCDWFYRRHGHDLSKFEIFAVVESAAESWAGDSVVGPHQVWLEPVYRLWGGAIKGEKPEGWLVVEPAVNEKFAGPFPTKDEAEEYCKSKGWSVIERRFPNGCMVW